MGYYSYYTWYHIYEKIINAIYNYFSNISSNIDYHISCSDKIGEGEHKIFEYIRNNEDYHSTSNTTIYMVLTQTLLCYLCVIQNYVKIFIYIVIHHHLLNQIDRNLDPNKSYLLNISLLKTTINNDFDGNDRVKDYIFICFF